MSAQPDDVPVVSVERQANTALSPRIVYEARIEVRGFEEDAAMAAVKLRAFLRRYFKPPGLTIRLTDEQNRPERLRGS